MIGWTHGEEYGRRKMLLNLRDELNGRLTRKQIDEMIERLEDER
jgi:hypothetical protein